MVANVADFIGIKIIAMGLFLSALLLVGFVIFVLAITKQYELDNSTTGTIISVETQTYTGSYGRRYTRHIVVYEFEDFQGRIWRGNKVMPNTRYLRKGALIPVRYSTKHPDRNDAEI